MYNLSKTLLPLLFLIPTQNVISDEQFFSEQSVISSLAKKSLLLQSDRYHSLLVVAGERGHILYSNNNKEWAQSTVATNLTLTNIFMYDEQTGWVVGHDAVILKTSDGAKTWQKVFSDINVEAPLLDLYFKDALNGIAIGGYSLMYITTDGGSSWQKSELILIGNEGTNGDVETSQFSDVYDFHLNDIAYAGENRFYIAAEAGHILRSDDDGKTWLDLPSPYRGSFFGVLPLSFNDVIAYGLRGHIYRSSDAGDSWQKIESATKEMLTDAVVLSNGTILVSGLAGTLLLSKDNGRTFLNVNLHHRHGLSAVLETEDHSILLTGEAGIQLMSQSDFAPDN